MFAWAEDRFTNYLTNWEWIRIRVDGRIRVEYRYVWTWKFLNPQRKICGLKISEYSRRCAASRTSLQQTVWRRSCQTSSDGSCPFRKRLLTFLKHLGPIYTEVGDPGRWANPLWWGNPPVHINSHFDYVYMKSGVTHRMLPHLSGVPHLYVNRERFDLLLRMFRWKRKKTQRRTRNLEPEPIVS